MPFCIKCGKENTDVAKFCTGCGTPMIIKVSPPTNTEIPLTPEKGKKRWIIIGSILLLVVLVLFYIIVIKKDNRKSDGSSSSPETVSVLPGIYPHASQRILNYEDIRNLGFNELRIMRNEIYARHGYIFQNSEQIDYFNGQSWYKPRYNNVTDMLSETEKKNIEFIKSYEH